MIAGMDEKDLVHITVAKKDSAFLLRWEHNQEFEYKGEMYDVVKRTFLGDSIRYTCWWDNDETVCNQKLKKLAAEFFGKRRDSQQSHARVQQFMKSLFFHPTSNTALAENGNNTNDLIFSLVSYSSPWQEVLSSPPDPSSIL
jgi:hypothetical protein